MSRIYAAGIRATALANILADIETYFSFNDAGQLVLNTQGLIDYMRDEMLSAAGAEYVSPATAATATAAAQAWNPTALANALNDSIKVERWSGRADWPTSTSVLAGGSIASAVKASLAELKARHQHVGDYFIDIETRLKDGLMSKFYEYGLDGDVPAGVVRQIETRSVIYTYVTDRGEESAPSAASTLVELDQNDSAVYTGTAPPGGRNVATVRWYRSRSSNIGADFAFVAETAYVSGSPNYTDEKKAEQLEEPCPTITWVEPPADLIGLIGGPNGGMAGFIEGSNTVCFCENHHGYAWPEEYRKTTLWPVVGIGLFDQTYVVLTRGKPYYMSGADSASLDSRMQDSNQACTSRRSIASTEVGVIYASADGLCLADPSGVRVITEALFDRESWQALTPDSIIGIEHEGTYYFAYYTDAETYGVYALHLKTGKLTTIDIGASTIYRDLIADRLYIASGTTIQSLFTSETMRDATWKCKIMPLARPANLGWLQVDSEFEEDVVVKVYRDGVLTDTKTVTSKTPVRLSSKHAIEHEVQVESQSRVTRVTLASTSEELRAL